ncbi:anhydro-N-acetylmuramic acid kinase (plasmid) [Pseudoalteromonas sp. T1lg65]|uniref:anhydro-N-acetylmuramic acid kinase n=1 Tax=Pseudoalteromonas sp. T1lg65 TaxID=2077101 RepID=UPI003F799BDA
MKNDVEKLLKISNKNSKIILGLMSGTSLDGLDLALCKLDGCGKDTRLKLLHFHTYQYTEKEFAVLSGIAFKQQVDLQLLCQVNGWLGELYARVIKQTLTEWNVDLQTIDLIASHGQTIYHAPKYQFDSQFNHSTLQLADADRIASSTGIITVSDFRQKHIAKGLEGAPLVHYGDYLLYSSNKTARVLLNIGGIANFTYLPAKGNIEQTICSDIGPGNTLIDQVMKRDFRKKFDNNGEIARQGSINFKLLNKLLSNEFIAKSMPKTTGPEVFNLEMVDVLIAELNENITSQDVVCTLTEFTALAIAQTLNHFSEHIELFVTGGGVHNRYLLSRLITHLNQNIAITSPELLDIDVDAKEAALFALLANECISGNADSLPFSMGKVSFPN